MQDTSERLPTLLICPLPEGQKLWPAFVQGLYVGSVGAACNKEALDRLGISHIVCVMAQWETPFPDDYMHHQIRSENSLELAVHNLLHSTRGVAMFKDLKWGCLAEGPAKGGHAPDCVSCTVHLSDSGPYAVMDNTQASLLVHLDPAIEFVTKAREGGGRVLLHCFAGRSRR